MTLTCSFTSGKWSPRSVFPPCYEIGNTPNNDNEEKLDNEDTRNPNPPPICENPPPPNNGNVFCNPKPDMKVCKAYCSPGYHFPDGSTEMMTECFTHSNKWIPYNKFPSCTGAGKFFFIYF
ncbi:uncharacterized protein LOC111639657 [Centruroides sculpturatus]|nr:uncharacterized protein LOC111639657 [Centruroides sculpturatus]